LGFTVFFEFWVLLYLLNWVFFLVNKFLGFMFLVSIR
jgi:hypothetical protein